MNRLRHLFAVGGVLIAAVGSASTWWVVQLETGAVIEVSGVDASALLWSVGAVALAAYGLQLLLRGVPRRVVSGLQLLSAGAFVAVTFVASSDPVPSALAGITAATGIAGVDALALVASVTISYWHVSAAIAGVLMGLSGLAGMTAQDTPKGQERFERSRSQGSSDDSVSAWDALTEGVDPTQR